MGARNLLRQYFLSHVGEVIETETLAQVAGIRAYARRIRELRDEEGYLILTHKDRASLGPTQYLLEDPIPAPGRARGIPGDLRAKVLRRDGFACRICGLTAGDSDPVNPYRNIILHVEPVVPNGGSGNQIDDFAVVCSACKAGRLGVDFSHGSEPGLLAAIRNAPREVQREAYELLSEQFDA